MSSTSPIITEIEQAQVKKLPAFRPGDTVRVHFKILEGDKTRVQAFEGVCIALRRGGNRGTVTVRKMSFGQGVERIFPLASPQIDKVDVVQRGRVRRARLFYLRNLRGKKARIKALAEFGTAVAARDEAPAEPT
ncbi:MAG: 50S ribosomal protein L19 [Deltaproteobacteria bacterium RBG_16_71_12]|nr:MAG: 50S ribosomal protein L19 [Deltaproteobacteria bacterium RBG_16_71_12]